MRAKMKRYQSCCLSTVDIPKQYSRIIMRMKHIGSFWFSEINYRRRLFAMVQLQSPVPCRKKCTALASVQCTFKVIQINTLEIIKSDFVLSNSNNSQRISPKQVTKDEPLTNSFSKFFFSQIFSLSFKMCQGKDSFQNTWTFNIERDNRFGGAAQLAKVRNFQSYATPPSPTFNYKRRLFAPYFVLAKYFPILLFWVGGSGSQKVHSACFCSVHFQKSSKLIL